MNKNTAAIAELTSKFASLEAKVVQKNLAPSYRELLDEVKALEEERDSLLRALRLLKEDFNSNQVSSSDRAAQQDDDTV